jgi:hypothetical protein
MKSPTRAKKPTSGISFYFILYTVAIITVFVITMERDQLLRQRDEDLAHLVQVYIKPLQLSASVDTARFFVAAGQSLTAESLVVRAFADGPIDKKDITYSLVDAFRILPDGSDERVDRDIRLRNIDGEGVLVCPPVQEGTYLFTVAGYKKRILSDGKTMKVLIKDTSYVVAYSRRLEKVDRDTTLLIVKVERSGLVPPQLILSVQETRENWVLNVPYRKKIFVGGVESLSGVSFTASAPGRMERTVDAGSFVTLVWEKPNLGQQLFTVAGDAGRGFGTKDRGTVTFTVEVRPATFVTPPAEKGFWGIPYVFDGQIVGINPLDLAVQAAHDGQQLHVRPAVPRDTIVPERTWNILAFRVLYHDATIREHRVQLSAPPPPQIRWVQQNLDRARHVYVITLAAADPVGGPVRVSLQSQPAGIVQLDKIRGTTFTITVNLESKPSAVYLKLTATDQYGGQSVSSRQFNLSQ